jgi:glycosyltransferase involved in cell wall biosynthesis
MAGENGILLRVVFLIRSLGAGGAEKQLLELVKRLDPNEFDVTVVSYYTGGELWEQFSKLPSVRLVSAGKRRRWDVVGFLLRLYSAVSTARPDVIHGYMRGANELSLLFGVLCRARVVWGVRASALNEKQYDWLTRVLGWTGARLSRWADLIIANSEAGRRDHCKDGYPERRTFVIANGIDTERFRRDEAAAQRVRSAWGIRSGAKLVGIVGRVDPIKGHRVFFEAAALACSQRADIWFAVVGPRDAAADRLLRGFAERVGVTHRVLWDGYRTDMPAVHSAFDILASCSDSEGFSNVIGEAMACETLCVATDVGDAARIIGNAGLVVPPNRPEHCAAAWLELLAMSGVRRRELGAEARARIVRSYSAQRLAEQTAAAFRRIVGQRHPTRRVGEMTDE